MKTFTYTFLLCIALTNVIDARVISPSEELPSVHTNEVVVHSVSRQLNNVNDMTSFNMMAANVRQNNNVVSGATSSMSSLLASVQGFLASPLVQGLLSNRTVRAVLADPAVRAVLGDARVQAVLANPAVRAVLRATEAVASGQSGIPLLQAIIESIVPTEPAGQSGVVMPVGGSRPNGPIVGRPTGLGQLGGGGGTPGAGVGSNSSLVDTILVGLDEILRIIQSQIERRYAVRTNRVK